MSIWVSSIHLVVRVLERFEAFVGQTNDGIPVSVREGGL